MLSRKQWFRCEEIAQLLDCSTRHVQRLCETGKLIAFRLGEGKNSPLRVQGKSVIHYIAAMRELYETENGIFRDGSD